MQLQMRRLRFYFSPEHVFTGDSSLQVNSAEAFECGLHHVKSATVSDKLIDTCRDIARQVKMGVSPKDLRLDSALKDTAGAVDVERGGGQADSSERTVALTRDQFHSLFADVEGQHGSQNEGLGTGANSDNDNDEYEAVFFSNVHAAATAPLRLAQPGADAGANASSDKTGLGMATNV